MANELDRDFLDSRLDGIIDHLEAHQAEDGEFRTLRSFCKEVGNYVRPTEYEGWYDFGKCAFLAATILFHLGQIPLPRLDEIKRKGCAFLLKGFENGVVRYQPAYHKTVDIPADLDDTSMTANALRQNGHAVEPNVAMIEDNTNRHGDFYMWLVPRWRHLRHPRNLLWLVRDHLQCRRMMKKWASSELIDFTFREYRESTDAGVAANVLLLLGESERTRKHLDRLIDLVSSEAPRLDYYGLLPVYFHVARLYHHGVGRVSVLRPRILSFLEGAQDKEGCIEQELYTAAAALTLMYFEEWESDVLERAIRYLARHPMHESGFRPVHYYHDTAGVFEDGGAEMTATLFLEALYRYRVHRHGDAGPE